MAESKIKWPEADLKRIAKQINRAQIKMGKTLEQAVIWAGCFLAKSASARTKSAPKKRRAYANKGDDKFSKKAFPYYREIWKKGPENTFKFYLKEKSDNKYEKIKNSGLAKKSFLWMISGIKGSGNSNFASEVNKKNSAFEIKIEMSNKLPYILNALKESEGQHLLNQALGKAASRMEKTIDKRLKALA